MSMENLIKVFEKLDISYHVMELDDSPDLLLEENYNFAIVLTEDTSKEEYPLLFNAKANPIYAAIIVDTFWEEKIKIDVAGSFYIKNNKILLDDDADDEAYNDIINNVYNEFTLTDYFNNITLDECYKC